VGTGTAVVTATCPSVLQGDGSGAAIAGTLSVQVVGLPASIVISAGSAEPAAPAESTT
jgi:hypothetical protein